MKELKKIITSIKEKQKNIKSVYLVGCGASKADLYPAKYFLDGKAKNIRACLYTSNEFNYATPTSIDDTCIVITCSLSGETPETAKATTVAKEHGAHTIAVTHGPNSAITKDADYTVEFNWGSEPATKLDKMTKVLMLAVEVLDQYEGYNDYESMVQGIEKLPNLINSAANSVRKDAKIFAERYKDVPVIYVMSSGATHEVAYSFSICLMMEMQWINSGSFHDGEFFHGPFEIVDKDVPFLLLMNDGRTRPMDSRALDFLQRFDAQTTVVDAKDHGLATIASKEIIDYLNPMLITGIIRVYAEELSYIRSHPLTKRRYMWKLEY